MKKLLVTALAVVSILTLSYSAERGAVERTLLNSKENVAEYGSDTTNQDAGRKKNRRQGKKLRNISDSISYALGVQMWENIDGQSQFFMTESGGTDINLSYLIAGIKEAYKSKSLIADGEGQVIVENYVAEVYPRRNLEREQKFLAKVEAETEGIGKTDSGLLYLIEEPGSNTVKAVSLKDTVEVSYIGTLPDGTVFDSSYEKNRTLKLTLDRCVRGWSEGLMLIGEGGRITLWIPSELGYGSRGIGYLIEPNTPLVYEVELLKVYNFRDE